MPGRARDNDAITTSLPSNPVELSRCAIHKCGGMFINNDVGWESHRTVFGHDPALAEQVQP